MNSIDSWWLSPLPHRVALLLLLAFTCACGATPTFFRTEVKYSTNVLDNYNKGLQELKGENWEEAIKYFTYVRNKFPFSEYATLAELRLADVYFAQEKYTEAADAYKNFIKFHPTRPQTLDGYASFRVAEAYVKQIPGGWFLVPPTFEKDQSATRDALRELVAFSKKYTTSKYLPQAQKLYRECIQGLADHELYVAKFYLDHDKPKGAIFRLEGMLKRYPAAGIDAQVMFLLGQTYLKLNERKKAHEVFVGLTKKFPEDHHSAKAKLYLRHLADQGK
jgi:outer membrane protein assembly factor BamD